MTRDLHWRITAARRDAYLCQEGVDETNADAQQFLAAKLEQFCADHLILNRELWRIQVAVREVAPGRAS